MAHIYDRQGAAVAVLDYDRTVKAVAHRGFSSAAPENTLPAYRLAKEKGFFYVETDVSFTSDGVAVCLHDSTVDRTSTGSGSISALTFAQVREYDFGSWKSSDYAGTVIPSFEEFIALCRNIGLHPYIEIKNSETYTEAQVRGLVDIVESLGMKGKVTWISFSSDYLTYVKNYDASARLGYITGGVNAAVITTAQGLRTEENEVFVDANVTDAASAALCLGGGLPMESWTVDSAAAILNADPYITGFTSNSLIAGKVLYENSIQGS